MPETFRNVFCVGRNYAEHARELRNEIPAEPVIFLKPVSAICRSGDPVVIPPGIGRVDHEVEVVARIGRAVARGIDEGRAMACVSHFAIGIDVTGRELQEKAKAKSLPWALAKGIDTFAPLSELVPASCVPDPSALDLELAVNGEIRQKGNTRDLLFPIPRIIAYLSRYFSLDEGDLIFTGTPAGVGPLRAGDRLVATLGGGIVRLETRVQEENPPD